MRAGRESRRGAPSRRRSASSRAARPSPSPPAWRLSPPCSTLSPDGRRSDRSPIAYVEVRRADHTPGAQPPAATRLTPSIRRQTEAAIAAWAPAAEALSGSTRSRTRGSTSPTSTRSRDAIARLTAILVVDATLATPVLLRPIELGADVVLHSATKYIGGHSDLLLGVSRSRAIRRLADGSARARGRSVGAVPGTMEAFLACAGCAPCRCGSSAARRARPLLAEAARRTSGGRAQFATPA